MTVYTRQGDKGETRLLGGTRVSKGDLQVEAYGTVDELNSVLGFARGFVRNPRVKEELERLQKSLFQVAGELALGRGNGSHGVTFIESDHIKNMEQAIDNFQKTSPLPPGFVLPGGTPATGALDLGRTVARRAERLVVRLAERQQVREELIAYLNRVSDFLWVLARVEDKEELIKTVQNRVVQQLKGPVLNLERARELTMIAMEKAREIGVPMVVALCDQGGNLISLQRQDGALLASIEIARDKAFTAAALKLPTHQVGEMAQPGQPLYGIGNTNGGRVILFGGGFPLKEGDQVVGGIGVSGGAVEEDMAVAQVALNQWKGKTTS